MGKVTPIKKTRSGAKGSVNYNNL